MMEENGDNCITLERMEPEGGDVMKNSGLTMEEATVKDIEETGSEPLKRNPTVIIVGPDHKFTVQSRYRGVSLGSCHDFCKLGPEHELENVTKRPLLGTIRESRPLVTKNKPLRRRLSLPGPIPERSPLLPTKCANFPKRRSQSTMRRVPSETKFSSVPTSGSSVSRSKTDYPIVKKTMHPNSSQKVEEKKTKEASSSSGSRKVKAKELMSKSPRTPLEKSPSVEGTLYKNHKSFSSSRCPSNIEDSKINKSRAVPEKAMHMVKSNAVDTGKALKSSLLDEESSSTQRASRDSEIDKPVSPAGRWTHRPKGESRQKSDSITKASGIAKEGGSTTNISRGKIIGSHQTKAEGTSICQPEEKEGLAWKIKFRRGTVVNAQVASNSARKLQFKRGRILGEDQSAIAGNEKSLNSRDCMTNDLPDNRLEPKKVHLRRQETSGKKDSIDLNNVIEETASKLVKTRKSKVKALVGAFETVMSFRDREHLPETSAS